MSDKEKMMRAIAAGLTEVGLLASMVTMTTDLGQPCYVISIVRPATPPIQGKKVFRLTVRWTDSSTTLGVKLSHVGEVLKKSGPNLADPQFFEKVRHLLDVWDG